ncbi:MAG: hypothetical protein WDM89_15155 [Rhizomicrobium sp.]
MQQAAENIYERTQPYRYAVYEDETQSANGGLEKARAILEELVESGSPNERVWGHAGLASLADTMDPPPGHDRAGEIARTRSVFRARVEQPRRLRPSLGHDEKAVGDLKAAIALFEAGKGEMNERAARILLLYDKATLKNVLDDSALRSMTARRRKCFRISTAASKAYASAEHRHLGAASPDRRTCAVRGAIFRR